MLKLAGRRIGVETVFGSTLALCRDYLDDSRGNVDFTVRTTAADIAFEREKSRREDEAEGNPARQFSDEYLETLAVYRKIAGRMPDYNTFLFHGSAIAVDGTGYLFTAKSGTGKSTHTRLWRELLGNRAVMLNDDKPLIHVDGDSVTVYGTPWDGKHRLSSNLSVPLRALCLLERGQRNEIHAISPGEAWPMLLQQAYRPADAAAMMKTLALLDRLTKIVKLYRLRCNMKPDAAEMAWNTMEGSRNEAKE